MPPDENVQSAIEKLERRFAENSQGRVFAHLADAYRKAGDFSKAEGLILHGLKNHPNYISAYIVLGRIYLESERFSDAHEQFSKVLDLDPHNLIALKALGDLAAEAGRLEDARSWYERLLQVDPRNQDAEEALRELEAGGADTAASAETEPPSRGARADSDAQEGALPWETSALTDEQDESSRSEGAHEPRADQDAESLPTFSGEEISSGTRPWEPAAGQELPDFDAEDAFEVEPGSTESTGEASAAGASGASFSAADAAGEESSDLDLERLENWTPGFLRNEDMAGETAEDESSMENMFDDLDEDVFLDLGGEQPDEADAGASTAGDRPVEEGADSGLVTETMAELYTGQGLYEDALRVYRQLAEERPNDEHISAQIWMLERRIAEAGAASAARQEREPVLDLGETETVEGVTGIDREEGTSEESAEAFDFAAKAPPEGLLDVDPFAGSFAAFAEGARPAESDAAEATEEPDLLAQPDLITDADMFATADGSRIDEEATVGMDALEPASPGIPIPEPDVWTLGPDEVEAASPAVGSSDERAETETIGAYLTGLLDFDPGSGTGSVEAAGGSPQAASEAGGSEDLTQFQEWLKGLRR